MKSRTTANAFLRRAQIILFWGAVLPTVLTAPLGVLLLVIGESRAVDVVTGVLLLTFCASSLIGCIVGWVQIRRGAAAVRAQQEFLSTVSHELRTPMTSMRMFVEALLDDRLTNPLQRADCLNVLHRELRRLDALVERLLELSRIEARGHLLAREPIVASDLIDEAMAAMDAIRLQDPKPIEIQTRVEPDLELLGDRPALVQAIVNLLANAWKHGGNGEQPIELTARRSANDRDVEIIVQDHGPGIPLEERAMVFEKFARGRHAIQSGTHGSGLGLAIVQGIAKAHGGRVELRNPATGGAAFHLLLPRCVSRLVSHAS